MIAAQHTPVHEHFLTAAAAAQEQNNAQQKCCQCTNILCNTDATVLTSALDVIKQNYFDMNSVYPRILYNEGHVLFDDKLLNKIDVKSIVLENLECTDDDPSSLSNTVVNILSFLFIDNKNTKIKNTLEFDTNDQNDFVNKIYVIAKEMHSAHSIVPTDIAYVNMLYNALSSKPSKYFVSKIVHLRGKYLKKLNNNKVDVKDTIVPAWIRVFKEDTVYGDDILHNIRVHLGRLVELFQFADTD
jgi:hypothetical protein